MLNHEVEDFRQAVEACGLEDLNYGGSYYTWSNRNSHGERVYSKLDRVLVNQEWVLMWEQSRAQFLLEGISDHSPALVLCGLSQVTSTTPFRYCEMWASHPEFPAILRRVWESQMEGSCMFQVVSKLKQLKQSLKQLHRQRFRAVHEQVDILRVQLATAQKFLQSDPLNLQLQENE